MCGGGGGGCSCHAWWGVGNFRRLKRFAVTAVRVDAAAVVELLGHEVGAVIVGCVATGNCEVCIGTLIAAMPRPSGRGRNIFYLPAMPHAKSAISYCERLDRARKLL